jgi:hypothetical protein
MLNTFVIALIVSGVALVYWRLTLLVLAAVMIAMLVTGIETITGTVSGQDDSGYVGVLDEPRPDQPPLAPPPGPGQPGQPAEPAPPAPPPPAPPR